MVFQGDVHHVSRTIQNAGPPIGLQAEQHHRVMLNDWNSRTAICNFGYKNWNIDWHEMVAI